MAENVTRKQFLNAFINNSSTVQGVAGADIIEAAHKAVMFDTNGDVVLADSGDKAFGVILSTVPAIENGSALITKKGFEIDVLIKDIGLIEAGGAIAKGDPLTINATGQVVAATSGDFIFGWAFTAASGAGELAHIQITRSGYKS